MLESILSLGNKIEMQEINVSLKDDFEHKRKVYVSQILEFDEEEEDVLYIAMPIFEGRIIPIDVGSRYDLYFYTKRGMYTCTSQTINRYKSGNIYVLVVKIMNELKKYQRRQYFRLETNLQFNYKVFTEEDEKYFRRLGKISEEMQERPYESAMTLDISGGGMRFVTKNQFATGLKIMVRLVIENGAEKLVSTPMARVISSVHAKGRNDLYENRIEFVQIQQKEREALIKYIFAQERIIRKKQLE